MTAAVSLRTRLTLIILVPLLLIACLLGVWAWRDALTRASDRFDLSLLSAALAISRDTALSGGDALSQDTRDLLRSTSGGPVFYHVFAPDGVFVTGYATPPVPPSPLPRGAPRQSYYDAVYRGSPVRVLRFVDAMTIEGLTGDFTFTVWQDTTVRQAFVNSLSQRTFVIVASLLAALACLVWFGVRIGLRPLGDLGSAIARRSSADLSPIRRAIPAEVSGLVERLNGLLQDLSSEFAARDRFISDAAHQLRNPVAGVLSLAESLRSAVRAEDRQERTDDLVTAARELRELADGLLLLERAQSAGSIPLESVDVADVLHSVTERLEPPCRAAGVTLDLTIEGAATVRADPLLLDQAIANLIANALLHGGPGLRRIEVTCRRAGTLEIVVADDGRGIDEDKAAIALARFGQVNPTSGSGLGLPIAQTAVRSFGGELRLCRPDGRFAVQIELPIEPEALAERDPAAGPRPSV